MSETLKCLPSLLSSPNPETILRLLQERLHNWLVSLEMGAGPNTSPLHSTGQTVRPSQSKINLIPQVTKAGSRCAPGEETEVEYTHKNQVKTSQYHIGKHPLAQGRCSSLCLSNSLCSCIKPLLAHGIQLLGSAKNTNVEIVKRFQTKTVRAMVRSAVCAIHPHQEGL